MAANLNIATALADLLSPITFQTFVDDYWERKHLFISRGNPDYYSALGSLEDVDRWLHAARESPREILDIVPSLEAQRRTTRQRVRDLAMDKLYNAFCSGDTIVLNGVQDFSPPLALLMASLEERFNSRFRANMYLAPAGAQVFRPHVDPHDIFVLQIQGTKDWHLYEPLPAYQFPVETLSHSKAYSGDVDPDSIQLLEHAHLEPGDFLYLPGGFPHTAMTTEGISLHLTLSARQLFWLDLLKTVIEVAGGDSPEMRHALDFVDLSASANDPEMLQKINSLLGDVQPERHLSRALAALARAQVTSRSFPPDGHFAQLARLDELTAESVVERRTGLRCAVESKGDHAVIYFSTNKVQGPASIEPALQYIADQRQFRIKDLPGNLGDESKVVLTRRLIREGLLRRVG